jgi:hypothetical protein
MEFHIYRQTQLQTQINDRNTVKPNAIFDLICSHDPLLTTTPWQPTTPTRRTVDHFHSLRAHHTADTRKYHTVYEPLYWPNQPTFL